MGAEAPALLFKQNVQDIQNTQPDWQAMLGAGFEVIFHY
jgi:hypothetical protein